MCRFKMNNLLLYECKYNMIVEIIVLIYNKKMRCGLHSNSVPDLWFVLSSLLPPETKNKMKNIFTYFIYHHFKYSLLHGDQAK